jgi:cytoskeletal protein CcmA (bactofilin family)
MKEKRREMDESKITGFFDKDTTIRGDLNFKGSFRIDGQFKGTITSESTLVIGESGKVEADLQVGHVIIDGEIKGNVTAKNKVEIHSNGRVFGTVVSPKLVIEEGAHLEAQCQTTDKIPPAKIGKIEVKPPAAEAEPKH